MTRRLILAASALVACNSDSPRVNPAAKPAALTPQEIPRVAAEAVRVSHNHLVHITGRELSLRVCRSVPVSAMQVNARHRALGFADSIATANCNSAPSSTKDAFYVESASCDSKECVIRGSLAKDATRWRVEITSVIQKPALPQYVERVTFSDEVTYD